MELRPTPVTVPEPCVTGRFAILAQLAILLPVLKLVDEVLELEVVVEEEEEEEEVLKAVLGSKTPGMKVLEVPWLPAKFPIVRRLATPGWPVAPKV
jgi:hypothetical protein